MSKKLLSLAEFKRNAATGKMGLQLVEFYGKKTNQEYICPVVDVMSRAVKLRKKDGTISILDLDYASLVEYDGETLKVYEIGIKDGVEDTKVKGDCMLVYKVYKRN